MTDFSPTTPLDHAFTAMISAPDDDVLHLRFFERVADAELYIPLRAEPKGSSIDPKIFDIETTAYVAAFDLAERFADFAQAPQPYAVLSGRTLATMLAAQQTGVALNPDVAVSSHLIAPELIDWLADTLQATPDQIESRISQVFAPSSLPETLLTSLDSKLASAGGLARYAYLTRVAYVDGPHSHALAFVDAKPEARAALAQAVSEALTFSGVEAGMIDVMFVKAADQISASLAKVGLRFDLPEPSGQSEPKAPGRDPDAPPILK